MTTWSQEPMSLALHLLPSPSVCCLLIEGKTNNDEHAWLGQGRGSITFHFFALRSSWVCFELLCICLWSTILSLLNESELKATICSHTYPCHNTASTIFNRWCDMLWFMIPSFPSPHPSLPILLVHVNLGFNCIKNLVPELGRVFFFTKERNLWSSTLVILAGLLSLLVLLTSSLHSFFLRMYQIVDMVTLVGIQLYL